VTERDGSLTGDDRLMFLSEAVALVPFSETTLRRAIARGELEAWQPNSGKLVMWRSALFEWVTRRPAKGGGESAERNERRPKRTTSRRPRRGLQVPQSPDPITLPDVA
jgi:hypothetical protein